MAFTSCDCRTRCVCNLWALIISVVVGVVTAFLQITGVITVTPVFLWVASGVAAVILLAILAAAALRRRTDEDPCLCRSLTLTLAALLATILLALLLLAVGIVATSILSAIGVGLLLFAFTLTLTGTTCYVRALSDCGI